MCHGWVRDSMKEFKLERPSYHVLQSIVNRDLKHHDGSHDDGIPEANFLFWSCAETE